MVVESENNFNPPPFSTLKETDAINNVKQMTTIALCGYTGHVRIYTRT